MTKRFSDINRRSIIKGAAWAAPVVAATATIPAYAASSSEDTGYSPYLTQSQKMTTKSDYSTRTYISTLTTAESVYDPETGVYEKPGFLIGLAESNKQSTVALTSLEYYIAIPAVMDMGEVKNLSSSVSGSWSSPERVDVSSLSLYNKKTVDVSNYHVYKMTFTGNTADTIYSEANAQTWPTTPLKLQFSSTDSSVLTPQTYYAGYVVSFVLGATNYPYNNRSLIREATSK